MSTEKKDLRTPAEIEKSKAWGQSATQISPDDEAREWVYQHLNNGNFGLIPSNAHKLQLSLFRHLNIELKKDKGEAQGREEGKWTDQDIVDVFNSFAEDYLNKLKAKIQVP